MGSIAVDGLIAGGAAGVAMIAYLLPTAGEAPAELLSRFSGMGMQPSALLGAVGHLAVCAIYGMAFSILWRVVRGSDRRFIRVMAGIVYGLILFVTAEWIILPAIQSPLLDIPAVHWGIAHAIYGIMLGYLYRSGRS
jgi:uncharacterized membrane protein YagU involved in acid resistance